MNEADQGDVAARVVALYRDVEGLDALALARRRALSKEVPMDAREALSWALLALRERALDPELQRFVAPEREAAAIRQQKALDYLEQRLAKEA